MHGRKDNDFNLPGFPIVDYDDFTVFDATLTYRLARAACGVLSINNVFDAFYYEKIGYPLQGSVVQALYRIGFGR